MESAAGKVGRALRGFLVKAKGKLKAAKDQVRNRLSAKAKEAKDRAVTKMVSLIGGLNADLGTALDAAAVEGRKLRGHGIVAWRRLGG